MENNHSSKKIYTNSRHICTVPVAGSSTGPRVSYLVWRSEDQDQCPDAHIICDEDEVVKANMQDTSIEPTSNLQHGFLVK